MLEVGDAEVEDLLKDVDLLQEGVLLLGVAHLQGEALLQDVEEVLMMEVDPGVEEVEEVKTGALQEGDRLQGEVPLLVGALRHAAVLLQEGAHLHAAMDLPAMKAHQTGGVIVQQ